MSTRTRIKNSSARPPALHRLPTLALCIASIFLLLHTDESLAQEGDDLEPPNIQITEVIDRAELGEVLSRTDWSDCSILEVEVRYGIEGITWQDLHSDREDWGALPPVLVEKEYALVKGKVTQVGFECIVIEEHNPDIGQALQLLKKISPAHPKSKQALAAAKRLGAGSCLEREAAQKELEGIGFPALFAILKGMNSADPEVRARAAAVLPDYFFERLGLEVPSGFWTVFNRGNKLPKETLSVLIGLSPMLWEPLSTDFDGWDYFATVRDVTLAMGPAGVDELIDKADASLTKAVLVEIAKLALNEKTRAESLPLITRALPKVDLKTRLELLWVYAPPKRKYVPLEPKRIGPFFPDKELERLVREGEDLDDIADDDDDAWDI